jgi:signal peptidase II
VPRPPPSTLPITLAVLALDQATKAAVAGWDAGARVDVVPRLLTLAHLRNPDGALGLLGSLPLDLRLLAFGVATGALFALGLAFARDASPRWLVGLGLGSVFGGALGNAADRALRGQVIDPFIAGAGLPGADAALAALGLAGMPAFNIADAALGVGFGALASAIAWSWVAGPGQPRRPVVEPAGPGYKAGRSGADPADGADR